MPNCWVLSCGENNLRTPAKLKPGTKSLAHNAKLNQEVQEYL